MPDIGDKEHTDLEFIQKRVDEGNWFNVTGAIDAITNTIEYVPATGKRAMMFSAFISIPDTNAPGSFNACFNADFKIDAVVKDKATIGQRGQIGGSVNADNANTSGSGYGDNGKFNVLGLSLDGNAVKKIEIVNTLDLQAGATWAYMSGWLVNI